MKEVKQEIIASKANENDVISGRGNYAKQHPANKKFNTSIKEQMIKYDECKSNKDRNAIVEEIKSQVNQSGGRFLKEVETPSKNRHSRYTIMREESVNNKIKQALRDAMKAKKKEMQASNSTNTDSSEEKQKGIRKRQPMQNDGHISHNRPSMGSWGENRCPPAPFHGMNMASVNGHIVTPGYHMSAGHSAPDRTQLQLPLQSTFAAGAATEAYHQYPLHMSAYDPNSKHSMAFHNSYQRRRSSIDPDQLFDPNCRNTNQSHLERHHELEGFSSETRQKLSASMEALPSIPQHQTQLYTAERRRSSTNTKNIDPFSQSMSSLDSWGTGSVQPLGLMKETGHDSTMAAASSKRLEGDAATWKTGFVPDVPFQQQLPSRDSTSSIDISIRTKDSLETESQQMQRRGGRLNRNIGPTRTQQINRAHIKHSKRHSTGSISTHSSSYLDGKRISLLSEQSKACRQLLDAGIEVLTGPESVRAMSILSGTSSYQYLDSSSFRKSSFRGSSLLESTMCDSIDDMMIRDSMEMSRCSSRVDYLSEDVSMKFSDDSTVGLFSSLRRNAICLDERKANKLLDVIEVPEEENEIETSLLNRDVVVDHKPSKRVSTLATPSTSRNNSQVGFSPSHRHAHETFRIRSRLSQMSIARSSIFSKFTDESSFGYLVDDRKGVDEMLFDICDITKTTQDLAGNDDQTHNGAGSTPN